MSHPFKIREVLEHIKRESGDYLDARWFLSEAHSALWTWAKDETKEQVESRLIQVYDNLISLDGHKKRAFFMTIRLAVAWRPDSPPIVDIINFIGRKATLKRLSYWIDVLHDPEYYIRQQEDHGRLVCCDDLIDFYKDEWEELFPDKERRDF